IIEKSIYANTPQGSVTYAVAFLPFSREVQEKFYKELQTVTEMQKLRTRLILLLLASILIFFATYLGLFQYRKIKARKIMQQRYRALQEEAQKVIQQLEEEEIPVGSEEEALIEQLKDYLKQVAEATPEEVATVLKVWITEKG
ncbi:MAG: flagellar M-ring protein FliF, partial [Fervidobacterium sp.]